MAGLGVIPVSARVPLASMDHIPVGVCHPERINLAPELDGPAVRDRVEYGDIDNPSYRAFFESISLMRNAAKIKALFLLRSGANDPRNGVGEHDEFVAAIRAAGGKVQYRRYEGEGHVMKQVANIIDFNRAKVAFLREQLQSPSKVFTIAHPRPTALVFTTYSLGSRIWPPCEIRVKRPDRQVPTAGAA